MQRGIFYRLSHEKPCYLLIGLLEYKETNMSDIAKFADMQYYYAIKILRSLTFYNLIRMEKIGHQRRIRLTEKGFMIASLLSDIKKRTE